MENALGQEELARQRSIPRKWRTGSMKRKLKERYIERRDIILYKKCKKERGWLGNLYRNSSLYTIEHSERQLSKTAFQTDRNLKGVWCREWTDNAVNLRKLHLALWGKLSTVIFLQGCWIHLTPCYRTDPLCTSNTVMICFLICFGGIRSPSINQQGALSIGSLLSALFHLLYFKIFPPVLRMVTTFSTPTLQLLRSVDRITILPDRLFSSSHCPIL